MRTRKDKREYLKGINDTLIFLHNMDFYVKLQMCGYLLFRPKNMKKFVRKTVRECMDEI